MTDVLSTDDVPEHERHDFLHEMMRQTYVPVTAAPVDENAMSITVTADQVGDLGISQIQGDGVRVGRTARLIAQSGEDRLILGLLNRGTALGRQDGRDVLVRPGDLMVWDNARPYDLQLSDDYLETVLVLPRRLLGFSETDFQRVTATALRPDEGVTSLVGSFMTGLAQHAATVPQASVAAVADSTISLVQALFTERGIGHGLEPDAAAATLMLRIRSFIDAHLADPELSPDLIAAAHNISVRYLHKLFTNEETTVQRRILRRRLEECRRELSHPAHVSGAVTAIAHSWGFADATHFSRCFHAANGMSPRAWRKQAATAAGSRSDQ